MLACITLFTIASNCFDAIVRFINDNDYSTWTAANNQFSNWTLASITSILSQIPLDGIADPFQPNITLPSDFDAKQKWPSSIHPVRNQNNCGSCWAFALTGMMSDRFAIKLFLGSELLGIYAISCKFPTIIQSFGYWDINVLVQ